MVVFVQNAGFSYLHNEKELELHIWRIRSTHEYYNLVQYDPKTPTHLRDTAVLLFPELVIYKGNLPNPIHSVLAWIFTCIFQNLWSVFLMIKKSFFSKPNFLGHAPWLKSSKIHFYSNPTTDFVTRQPYIVPENLPKIRKIHMIWDILQWAPSYLKTSKTSKSFGSKIMLDIFRIHWEIE